MTKQTIPYYRPWSRSLLDSALTHAKHNLFMLDVQMGSSCNANCPRCDSSCRSRMEPTELDVEALNRLIREMYWEREAVKVSSGNIKRLPPIQGYICGLGESTAGENLAIFKQLLRDLVVVNWSAFINGLYWDDELSLYLSTGHLAVAVQHNGNDNEIIRVQMGLHSYAKVADYLKNRAEIYRIAQETRGEDGGTNVCGSQVPMQLNAYEMTSQADEIITSGAFPLIAELEEAGYCTGNYYRDQKVETDRLLELHGHLVSKHKWQYRVPICPAVIGALHIDNRNQVTVDAATGWSCGWPTLREGERVVIGDIRKMHYRELADAVIDYRRSRLHAVYRLLQEAKSAKRQMVFGGCGGQLEQLAELYLKAYDAI